jgi:hypothetical protein
MAGLVDRPLLTLHEWRALLPREKHGWERKAHKSYASHILVAGQIEHVIEDIIHRTCKVVSEIYGRACALAFDHYLNSYCATSQPRWCSANLFEWPSTVLIHIAEHLPQFVSAHTTILSVEDAVEQFVTEDDTVAISQRRLMIHIGELYGPVISGHFCHLYETLRAEDNNSEEALSRILTHQYGNATEWERSVDQLL